MKKKILLFICLVTVATLSFAQEMAQDWNTPMGQPRTAKSAYSKELVQIDANGNTYVCGEFSQDLPSEVMTLWRSVTVPIWLK